MRVQPTRQPRGGRPGPAPSQLPGDDVLGRRPARSGDGSRAAVARVEDSGGEEEAADAAGVLDLVSFLLYFIEFSREREGEQRERIEGGRAEREEKENERSSVPEHASETLSRGTCQTDRAID